MSQEPKNFVTKHLHSKIPYGDMVLNLLIEGMAKFQMLNFPRYKFFNK